MNEKARIIKKNILTLAKRSGGSALTGTAKQKKWAEEIRANILKQVSADAAEILARYKAAKFWIENRNLSASEFARKAIEVGTLITKANTLLNEFESKVVIMPDRTIVKDAECDQILAEREEILNRLEEVFN